MLGIGQWGYVILIRGGFGGFCESRFLPRRRLAEGKLPSVLSLAQPVSFLFHLFLIFLCLSPVFTGTDALASVDCVFLFNRVHFFSCYQPPTHIRASCGRILSLFSSCGFTQLKVLKRGFVPLWHVCLGSYESA